MQSEHDRSKFTAVLLTALLCIVIEAFLLLVLTTATGSLAGAIGLSVVVLGPVSFWIAAPLYRYILRSGG